MILVSYGPLGPRPGSFGRSAILSNRQILPGNVHEVLERGTVGAYQPAEFCHAMRKQHTVLEIVPLRPLEPVKMDDLRSRIDTTRGMPVIGTVKLFDPSPIEKVESHLIRQE